MNQPPSAAQDWHRARREARAVPGGGPTSGMPRSGRRRGWLLALGVAGVLGAGAGCAGPAAGSAGSAAAPGQPSAVEGSPPDPTDPAAAALEAWEVFATRRVHAHWNDLLHEASLDAPPHGGAVEVECEVEADGRLVRADVVESSVDAVLTRYCLRAVRDRAPFAALPDASAGGGRHVWRITFVYEHRDRRRQSQP